MFTRFSVAKIIKSTSTDPVLKPLMIFTPTLELPQLTEPTMGCHSTHNNSKSILMQKALNIMFIHTIPRQTQQRLSWNHWGKSWRLHIMNTKTRKIHLTNCSHHIRLLHTLQQARHREFNFSTSLPTQFFHCQTTNFQPHQWSPCKTPWTAAEKKAKT